MLPICAPTCVCVRAHTCDVLHVDATTPCVSLSARPLLGCAFLGPAPGPPGTAIQHFWQRHFGAGARPLYAALLPRRAQRPGRGGMGSGWGSSARAVTPWHNSGLQHGNSIERKAPGRPSRPSCAPLRSTIPCAARRGGIFTWHAIPAHSLWHGPGKPSPARIVGPPTPPPPLCAAAVVRRPTLRRVRDASSPALALPSHSVESQLQPNPTPRGDRPRVCLLLPIALRL